MDFVDVDPEKDLPVFIDPFAIEIRSDPWSNECANSIRGFFDCVLTELRSGAEAEAMRLLGQLHEPRETYLGISKGQPQGRGVGSQQAKSLIDAIKKSKAFETGQLQDLSELALYVDGVNRDKVSDLTTNIIRRQLERYTGDQCRLHGIPLSDYNGPPLWDSAKLEWISSTVKLPFIEQNPILLVPKAIVRRSLSLNADDFYRKQILDFLQVEHVNAHSSLSRLVRGKPASVQIKKGHVKKPTKKDLSKIHPKSRTLIADMVRDHPGLL
ncbi:hypothetical protein [Pseudoroseicyclus aestuarii]|uniref:hypothetical protein n=1 Tax=Pseudoroseicyclus aestuarii TaxID=1795041 RepID=UPI0011B673D1|nr:hypothetical protein [Pseudoroseicyclus aestuarii]